MSHLPAAPAYNPPDTTERLHRAELRTQPDRDLAWYQQQAVSLQRDNARLRADLDDANETISDLRRQLGTRLRLVVKR